MVERHRFVWIWIGDPALADPGRIPYLRWCSDPGWAFDGGIYHVGCDYRLLVDNLMELNQGKAGCAHAGGMNSAGGQRTRMALKASAAAPRSIIIANSKRWSESPPPLRKISRTTTR